MNKKLNKKLLKSILCIASGVAIATSIPFATTSCGSSSSEEEINALPEEVYEIEGVTNTLKGFTKAFLNNPDVYSEYDTMQIPARVTSIGNEAFYSYQKQIIPSFIKNLTFAKESHCFSVGAMAFNDCQSLTSIKFPSSLQSIGEEAFHRSSALVSIDFSNATNLSRIDGSAFSSCSSLTSIDLSKCNKLNSMESYTFYYCNTLKSIKIPSNLTIIPAAAFGKCSALTSVDLSNATSLSSINGCAFEYCSSLTSVSLPESLNEIGNSAFWRCRSLRSINFPNNLSLIGNSVFYNCLALTSISLPSNLSTLGYQVFYNCLNLSSITWDAWNGNTTLQSSSFSGVCPDGGTVTVTNPTDDNHNSEALLNYLLDNGGLPESWRITTGPELPESVYNIDDNGVLLGFKSGIDLNKYEDTCDTMEIPARVTSINDRAFYNNSASTIPSFITKLTFAEGSSCSTIGGYAFWKCQSLTSVIFPSSFTEFTRQYAFNSCTSLASVDLSNCNNLSEICTHTFSQCTLLSDVKLPNNLKTIKSFAFNNCTQLKTINLPESLTSLDTYSFMYTGLISADLSNCVNLTSIGNYSFSHNESLTSVILPRNLNLIGGFVFCDNPLLNYIAWDIPSSLEVTIDSWYFDNNATTGTVKSLNSSVSSKNLLNWLKGKCSFISSNNWTAVS